MDLIAVTLPPVKSSAVKSDNTVVEQGGGRTADGMGQVENIMVARGRAWGQFTVGYTLTFVQTVRTCFAPQIETGECPRR